MSRQFSFRDLKLVPGLENIEELELVRPEYDETVNKILSHLGFSLNAPILYVPSLHRDLQGVVRVGFRACGEINNDPKYRNSPLCSQIEWLIWAAKKDPSLAQELSRMIGRSTKVDDTFAIDPFNAQDDDYTEPGYEQNAGMIEYLTKYRDMVRGSPYNEDGSLKLPGRK